MSTTTHIEWTDTTWNPVVGCTRVSAGCDHCYAVRQTHRLEAMHHAAYRHLTVLNRKGDRHFNGTVNCRPERLSDPLHWRKPRRVFVNSMSDLFHEKVPVTFIRAVFKVMGEAKQHTFQILTKRPERMAEVALDFHRHGDFCTREGEDGFYPFANVWLGTSCEDQKTAEERIPHLLRCPAALRFLSCEPLLGPINLGRGVGGDVWRQSRGVRWVIVGGESGPGARPCNIEWIRSIVAQCRVPGRRCFVKQFGSKPYDPGWHGHGTPEGSPMRLNDRKGGDPHEWPLDLRVREYPA